MKKFFYSDIYSTYLAIYFDIFSNVSKNLILTFKSIFISQQALEEDIERKYYHESGINELICLLQNLPAFFWELYDQR